jgi:hypothetical protein
LENQLYEEKCCELMSLSIAEVMISRTLYAVFISRNFDLAVLPSSTQVLVRDEICIPRFQNEERGTALAQCISSELRLAPVAALPQDTIAAFLKVSQVLISHAKAESKTRPNPDSVPDAGKQPSISPNGQGYLLIWLRCRCGPSLWSTLCQLKELIPLTLESEKLNPPSQTWWPKFMDRLAATELRA